jgi:hypothetical protein
MELLITRLLYVALQYFNNFLALKLMSKHIEKSFRLVHMLDVKLRDHSLKNSNIWKYKFFDNHEKTPELLTNQF